VLSCIKTADVLNSSYSKCHEEIAKRLSFSIDHKLDLNLLIFNFVFFFMLKVYPSILEGFLQTRFLPRDILSEVTSLLYGEPSQNNKEKVLNLKQTLGDTKAVPKDWDEWFYNICLSVAANSKCFSRKIGAVLVRDKSIISTGYNGPPRGVPTCDKRWFIDEKFRSKYQDKILPNIKSLTGVCPRRALGIPSGQGLELCPAGHAERNALINAARHGVKTKGTPDEPTTLYMSCNIPCSPCLVEIINAGVSEIVVTSLTYYDETAEYLLQNSELKVRLFNFLKSE